jgi:hypothetical protein
MLLSLIFASMGPLLFLGGCGLVVLVVGACLYMGVVAIRAIIEAVERMVEHTQTTIAQTVEGTVVRVATETAAAVSVAAWGPQPVEEEPGPEEIGQEGAGGADLPPWMDWAEEEEGWSGDPTDGSYSTAPSMDGRDRAIGVPPGFQPLGGIMEPDMSGEEWHG